MVRVDLLCLCFGSLRVLWLIASYLCSLAFFGISCDRKFFLKLSFEILSGGLSVEICRVLVVRI